jgi:hypothetical protein
MKKLLISLILLATMVLPLFGTTVSADANKYDSAIGIKQVKDNNIDVTYTGNHYTDSKGIEKYEYTSTIYTVPVYNDDGTPVDCAWYLDTKSGSYTIKNNVFSATVTGTAVTTIYQGETLSWNPVVMVDSKEYTAKGNPNKLAVDTMKSNQLGNSYGSNVIEWDYGICIRRVTVTEGKNRGIYI